MSYKCGQEEQSHNMILQLTNSCNLRCTYCFEGDTKPQKPKFMEYEVLEAAIEAMLNKYKYPHFTLFGGEPTLDIKRLEKVLVTIRSKSRAKKCLTAISITTNGLNICGDTVVLLNDYGVNVVFSFDGDKYSQNLHRRMANGKPSYDRVLDNLKFFVKTRTDQRYGSLIVRPTVTKQGLPNLVQTYKFLKEIGCSAVNPVFVSAKKTLPYAIATDDMNIVREQLAQLSGIYIDEVREGKTSNLLYQSLLTKIHYDLVAEKACDCAQDYSAISVDGEVFPCEGFLGIPEFSEGNIAHALFKNPSRMAVPRVNEIDDCAVCWARNLCGGGCYHEAYMLTGDISRRSFTTCDISRLKFEALVSLYARLQKLDLIDNALSLSKPVRYTENVIIQFDPNRAHLTSDGALFVFDESGHTVVSLTKDATDVITSCQSPIKLKDLLAIKGDTSSTAYVSLADFVNRFAELGVLKVYA